MMRMRNSFFGVVAFVVAMAFAGAATAEIVVYDDFDGTEVNPLSWTVQYDGTSAPHTVVDSVLTLNAPGGLGGSTDNEVKSTGTWGYDTFGFEIASAFTGSGNGFGIGRTGAAATVRRDIGGEWKLVVEKSGFDAYVGGPIATPEAGDVYKIVWSAAGVELYRGTHLEDSTSLSPSGSMGFHLFSYQNADGPSAAAYDSVSVGVVPEPSALLLMATGLIGLLAYAWRKRK